MPIIEECWCPGEVCPRRSRIACSDIRRYRTGDISPSIALYRLAAVEHNQTRRELLERMAHELFVTYKGHPYLRVAHPHVALNERVRCDPGKDASWCFWRTWKQPIGLIDELETAAGKIMIIMRPVEGGSR